MQVSQGEMQNCGDDCGKSNVAACSCDAKRY